MEKCDIKDLSSNEIEILAQKFINEPNNKNFSKLMDRCKWGLRGLIFNIVQDSNRVDEVYSIVMEHIYFKKDLFNPEISKFSTWIYKIALNDALKFKERGFTGRMDVDKVDIDINDYFVILDDIDDSDDYVNPFGDFVENMDDMMFNGKEYVTCTKNKIKMDIYDASVKCLDALPDHLRIVMKEKYLEHKKDAEIAQNNQIPVSSVKNWLRKGEKLVKEEVMYRYSHLYKLYKDEDF